MTKKYKTTHPKEGKKQSHCPICNKYVKYVAGVSGYICSKCIDLATDKDGKPIQFKTITEDGNGVQGVYKDNSKLYRSTVCYIKGVKCEVEVTPSGSIVNRPMKNERSPQTKNTAKTTQTDFEILKTAQSTPVPKLRTKKN